MRSITMTRRSLLAAVSAFALVLWFGNPSFAKDDNTHEGTVVSVSDNKLTMSGKDGKDEHTHDVGADAKVSLNGKDAKLADLKKGDKVKVTMGDDKKVSKIEAKRS
jgi:hypothetical protein